MFERGGGLVTGSAQFAVVEPQQGLAGGDFFALLDVDRNNLAGNLASDLKALRRADPAARYDALAQVTQFGLTDLDPFASPPGQSEQGDDEKKRDTQTE